MTRRSAVESREWRIAFTDNLPLRAADSIPVYQTPCDRFDGFVALGFPVSRERRKHLRWLRPAKLQAWAISGFPCLSRKEEEASNRSSAPRRPLHTLLYQVHPWTRHPPSGPSPASGRRRESKSAKAQSAWCRAESAALRRIGASRTEGRAPRTGRIRGSGGFACERQPPPEAGDWQDSRVTRCGVTTVVAALPFGLLSSISIAAAFRPMSRMARRTVVSGGHMRDASGLSS
jgi:hypothetical protein